MIGIDVFIWAWENYGILVVIIVILLIIIWYLLKTLLDPERASKFRAKIYKGIYQLSGSAKSEKKYIENDIKGNINTARKDMPFGKENIPKKIDIDWYESGEGQVSKIDEGEVIVKLDPSTHQNKNIYLLTKAIVNQTSLVGVRYILKDSLEEAIDLNLIKNLIKNTGNKNVLDWYLNNEYQPKIQSSEKIKNWNDKLVELDEKGLFTRLLLVELNDFSKKVSGRQKTQEMIKEIDEIINFLYKIVTRERREEEPSLALKKKFFKISIVLMGKSGKILTFGTKPYIDAIKYQIKEGSEIIYVIKYFRRKKFLSDSDRRKKKKIFKEFDEKIKKNFDLKKDFSLEYFIRNEKGAKVKREIIRYQI